MATEPGIYLRLLVPALVGWVAWVVYRAPYQERSNRTLAVFLVLIASGFILESAWLLFDSTPASLAFRWAQFILGLVDPPLLLAYSLTFPRPAPGWRPAVLVAVAAPIVAILALGLAIGHDSDLNFTDRGFAGASFAYTTAAYLLAFGLLLRNFMREARRFLSRQLFYLALGAGFVALSRTPAAFIHGGPATAPSLGAAMAYGALAVVGLLAATAALAWRWGRPTGRSPARFLLTLGLLLALFLGAWGGLLTLSPSAFTFFFGLRWVFFALIVGYGILRYQLFDFQAETWNTMSYLVAAAAGVLLALRIDAAADPPLGAVEARLLAVAAAMAAMAAAYLLLREVGRLLRRGRPPAAQRRILLDIYQATLEYATAPGPPSSPEQQLAETLREVFEVSPEEHERIMARLRDAE